MTNPSLWQSLAFGAAFMAVLLAMFAAQAHRLNRKGKP